MHHHIANEDEKLLFCKQNSEKGQPRMWTTVDSFIRMLIRRRCTICSRNSAFTQDLMVLRFEGGWAEIPSCIFTTCAEQLSTMRILLPRHCVVWWQQQLHEKFSHHRRFLFGSVVAKHQDNVFQAARLIKLANYLQLELFHAVELQQKRSSALQRVFFPP